MTDSFMPENFVLAYDKIRYENRVIQKQYFTGSLKSPIGYKPKIFKYRSWHQAEKNKSRIKKKTGIEFRIQLLI